VVGDTVNAAQRIEELGKMFSDSGQEVVVLASSATVEEVGMGFESFSVGEHSLPGRYGAMEVFRLS
jgi:class 3 adenylate cyclase